MNFLALHNSDKCQQHLEIETSADFVVIKDIA